MSKRILIGRSKQRRGLGIIERIRRQLAEVEKAPQAGTVVVNKHFNMGGSSSGGGAALTVEEADGTPTVANVTKIKLTNGTLTDDGSGVVSVAIGGGGGSVATDAIWDAKGDLAGGTGANTAAKLTAGANDTMLMAASGETTGLKWANKATVLAAIDREDADINALVVAQKIDDLTAGDDNTDLDVSTTKHGLAPKAVAPAAGLINVYGIANGETAITNKALFDATAPTTIAPSDAAAAGTATVAARRDHLHAAPATYPATAHVHDSDDVTFAPTTAADWDGAADPGDVEQALDQLAERQTNAAVFIPASAMWPSTGTGAGLVDGCAWPARREYTAYGTDVFYCAFDPATDESCQFAISLPVWDCGVVTATYHWTTVAAAGTTVCWSIAAAARSNDGEIDYGWGDSVAVTDTVLGPGDVHIITSGDITTSTPGTRTAGDLLLFKVVRDVSEDNCASDADLLGVTINYRRRDA